MSDLGSFQGNWLGKWHGGVVELPPGFGAGNASFSINAFATATAVNVETSEVVRGRPQITFEQAHAEWSAKAKWRDEVMRWADVEPVADHIPDVGKMVLSEKTDEPALEVNLDAVIPRLNEPVISLADLLADAKLLQLEQAQALESAIAVRDVLKMAELAYLAELAINQEKEALLAFIMFMD
jgi:hypothetical protein